MVVDFMSLKYYEGKICNVLTGPTNRNFKEESVAVGKPELYPRNILDHFMGRVIHVDNVWLTLQHPLIGTRSSFKIDNIIGIIEEQELNPNDPEHAKIIEQYSQKAPPVRSKVSCPNGHSLNVPESIEDGSRVRCPSCNVEFILGEISNNSDFVDVNLLKKISG